MNASKKANESFIFFTYVLCKFLMKQSVLIMYCVIIPCFIWLVKIAD